MNSPLENRIRITPPIAATNVMSALQKHQILYPSVWTATPPADLPGTPFVNDFVPPVLQMRNDLM